MGTQTGTPPTALDMAAKPAKFTTTVWSTRSPVIFSTVFTVHAGLPCADWPSENAELNKASVWVGVQVPFGSRHGGIVTNESRGIETATAAFAPG